MRIRRSILGALLALVLLLAIAGCSSSSGEKSEKPASAIALANVAADNTRQPISSIERATVPGLEEAWSLSFEGEGEGVGFTGSPVVVDGVAYFQDPDSNVRAFDLGSGRTLWEKRYEAPAGGPNGVIAAEGLVFGATQSAAFALDAATGEEVWAVELLRNDSEKIAMAPGYHDGLVYVATSPSAEKGNEVGILWALDAKSGRKVWHFDTVPEGLWGHPAINFGGGLSQPPAFDGEGSMYIGTGNPGPIPGTTRYPWGSSRPGPNLHASSIVKLDEKTGEVEWFHQVTPHALCNWDVGGPVLTESDGRKMVIAAGLSGIVVALDRETGKVLWERPVGLHNGHDDDGLVAMRGEYEKLRTPMTVYPGVSGGAAGPLSLRGSTVFVPVVDGATRLLGQRSAQGVGPERGQLIALDVSTGRIEWKRQFSSPLYGPTLATNDLVFATTFDGVVYAFDAGSGEEVWSEKFASYAEGGLTAVDDTLLVRAGYPGQGVVSELLAFRLAG